jgi:hypothetical protein
MTDVYSAAVGRAVARGGAYTKVQQEPPIRYRVPHCASLPGEPPLSREEKYRLIDGNRPQPSVKLVMPGSPATGFIATFEEA